MPAHSVGRPRLVGLLVLALALFWLLVGCAEQQEGKGTPPVAGSFVGEAPPADAFIALGAGLRKRRGMSGR